MRFMESGRYQSDDERRKEDTGCVASHFEDDDVLQEKCGVVGILSGDTERLHRMAVTTLPTIVHRGSDGTGYVFVGSETVKYHSLTPANQVAARLAAKEHRDSSIVLMQSRYATSGDAEKVSELQPYLRATQFGKLALAFNGNIWNWNTGVGGAPSLKEQAMAEGRQYPEGESSDTESFFDLISKSDRVSLSNTLIKDVFPHLKGGYSVLIAQEGTVDSRDKMFVARDPYGFHPLWWARTEDGDVIVASETCSFDALKIAHARFHEVPPGQLLIFEKGMDNPLSVPFSHEPYITGCSLELMYFMRVDSLMCINSANPKVKSHILKVRRSVGKVVGKRVLAALKAMGYDNLDNIDVIPVPESGLPFGRGVHDSLGKEGAHLNEDAVILNPDAPKRRSFISKDEAARRLVAMEKRKFMRDLFEKGRDLIFCDDTLIRGNTFRKLIHDAREYTGDKTRVHAVLSLDAFVDICPNGIAIKEPDELVSRITGAIDPGNLRNVAMEPIKEFIGLRPDDLLLFAKPDEIRQVVRKEMLKCGLDADRQKLCFACQGEDYPDGFPHIPVRR